MAESDPEQYSRTPLRAWAQRFADLPPGVTLREEPPHPEWNVQLFATADPRDLDLSSLPVELPMKPCTFTESKAGRALWLGPYEWLMLPSSGAPSSGVPSSGAPSSVVSSGVVSSGGVSLSRVAAALRGRGTVTDVSAQRTTLRLSGPSALDVLAQGCAVDLDPVVSPPGTCVQTMLARANVIVTVHAPDHSGDPVFELRVRWSFADYLAAWLVDATLDLD